MADRELDLPSPFAARYEIVRVLGHGASAVVYLVHDLQHDREVALKVLSPDYASALGPARFLREIRLASRLQHPYIVPIIDSGEWEGRLYYVMPVIEGQPLRTRLARERQLPIADAVRYTREIADALQHAHDHGVLHRDVKPENILLSGQHACLADFGIARALSPATGDEITTTGVVLGTPAYMSPEQATSDAMIDGRSDQYGLASVLFEMLAGVAPFVGPSEQSIVMQRFQHPAPSVRQYRPAITPTLESVIARALQSTAADRYPSVAAFSDALGAAGTLAASGEQAAVTPALSRRRVVVGSLLALGLLLSAALLWQARGDGEALAANVMNLIPDPGVSVSEEAAQAFDRARAMFASGRPDSAEEEFARAANADPAFALAALWQAQMMQWRSREAAAPTWTVPATRAIRNRGALSPRDAHHAAALLALGERRWADACGAFSEVVRLDSTSFTGWFGLGECRRLDRDVVPDSSSPSRWRFRAELSDAITSYTQALTHAPGEQSAPLFRRALRVFFAEPSVVRVGRALPPDSTRFIAYPAVLADTIGYVPYPVDQVIALARPTAPLSRGGGLQRSSDNELAFVRRWVQLMPGNPYALAAYSQSLETRGEIADDDSASVDALSLLLTARQNNRDPHDGIYLQAAQVRLLIKSGRYAEAGALIDSALTSDVRRDSTAFVLAALAALKGDEAKAAAHLGALWSVQDRSREAFGVAIPPVMAGRVAQLEAMVEAGTCTATRVDSMVRAVDDLAVTLEEPNRRGQVRRALLDDVLTRAAVCTDGASVRHTRPSPNAHLSLARAAAEGDRREVLQILSRFEGTRHGVSRSQLSWDAVALEGWALAHVGDSAWAAARLDSSLVGLPFSTNRLAINPRLSGGLRRALQLRAALAAAQSDDSKEGGRWRAALEALSGPQ